MVDRARLELLRHLAILDEGRRYLELGYGSTKHYLLQEFQLGRSDALEHIRIARRIHELPRLADALATGELRWSTLKLLSRLATQLTEEEWLTFAVNHTFEQTRNEVKRALQEGRDRPGDTSAYGLTNVMSRVSFEMTLEEKERFHTALARVADSMGDGAPRDVASVLTFLSQQILEGERVTGDAPSAVAVVYHQCPDCAASTVETRDGQVRVDADVVDRVTDIAETTTITPEELAEPAPLPPGEIDVPNSSRLAHKVRSRDGHRCANPGCDRRQGLQAHHIQYRSEGGRTAMANEVTLCRTCHTLVHAGLVKVDRTENGDLYWVPRAREVDAMPGYTPFPEIEQYAAPPRVPSTVVDGTDGVDGAIDLDGLVIGMTTLGYTKSEARNRLDAALAGLADGGGVVDEATLLSEALRNRG